MVTIISVGVVGFFKGVVAWLGFRILGFGPRNHCKACSTARCAAEAKGDSEKQKPCGGNLGKPLQDPTNGHNLQSCESVGCNLYLSTSPAVK